jgi:hypothetical protein
MSLKPLLIAMFGASTSLAAVPVIAHDEEDWEKRRHYYGHKKKGKNKNKQEKHRGYYVFYYVPYSGASDTVTDCPPAPDARIARPQDRPSLAQPAPQANARAPHAFPKESREQHALAGRRQRQILEKELATEQDLLELARRELGEQQGRIDRDGGDRSRLRTYMDNVELHERNVAALRRELSHLNR